MNEQLQLATPRARKTDLITAHEAASVLSPGNQELIEAIRRYVYAHGGCSQEEVAQALVPDESVSRWRRSTVISACKRAGLTQVGHTVNQRGRKVAVWALRVESVRAL